MKRDTALQGEKFAWFWNFPFSGFLSFARGRGRSCRFPGFGFRHGLLVGLFVLLIYPEAWAQNAWIEGTVTSLDSSIVLPGVAVYLEEINKGTATNGNGNYLIEDVPPGHYTLVASALGYLNFREEISVGAGEGLRVDFVMVEAVSTLAEVTVMSGGRAGLRAIPGSVHYLSPKDIQQFGYTDVHRVLSRVPGINIQEEDGFGLRPNIGLRGTGVERSSKITIMEDGVLMAPAPYAAPAAYYFPTLGRMQAVEVLKGSSQIRYGPYTTGGAINLISTPLPQGFSGRIHLSRGSFGGRNLHAFVGNSHKNFTYMVETFQYGSNGFKQLDGGGNTGFDKQDYLAKFRLHTKQEAKIYQALTFKVGQTREVSHETYLGLTEEDFKANAYRRYAASQKDRIVATHSQFSLMYELKLSEAFNITTTAYQTTFARNWYKLEEVKDGTGSKVGIGALLDHPLMFTEAYEVLTGATSVVDDALFVKANNRSYFARGVQSVWSIDFETGKVRHELDFGIRLHSDQVDRFQWVDEYAMDAGVMKLTKAGKPGTESNRIEKADALSVYVQHQWRLGKFTVTPGMRYEHISLERLDYGKADPERTGFDLKKEGNVVDVLIPGIGLDYRFGEGLSTFAGVHKGFSPPSSKAGAEPEKSINYELGLRYAKRSLSGELVLFFNDYRNLLGSDLAASGGGGTGELFNGGEVRAGGVEFQLAYDLLSGREASALSLPLSLTYTYTEARFQNSFESEFSGWGEVAAGDQLPYLANHQFSFIFGLEHRLFSLNLSSRYMGKMRSAPGQGDVAAEESIDAYFVVDASARYRLHEHLAFFASLTHLTNRVYAVARRPAGLRPGMPRAFTLGLKADF